MMGGRTVTPTVGATMDGYAGFGKRFDFLSMTWDANPPASPVVHTPPPPVPNPVDEPSGCIQSGPDCRGAVQYRDALSGTGKMFKRCDHHWSQRLDLQEELNQRYPEHPPADWSPLDAGESWYEDE